MIIQKLNGAFIADQDRVLLRISSSNQEELRFWLTRRTCMDFLISTQAISVKSIENQQEIPLSSAKAVDQFNQEVLAERINYQAPFEASNKLPLGHEPVLVKQIECLPALGAQENSIRIHLLLHPSKVISSQLNSLKLNAFRLLIERLMKEANWDGLTEKPAQVAELQKKPPLH